MSGHFLYSLARAKVPNVDGEVLACDEFSLLSGSRAVLPYLHWQDTCRQG
jgi:hypothetical protein